MQNFVTMPGRNLIPIVVALTVVGALLHRDYTAAGRVVTLVAIGWYLAARLRVAVALGRRWKRIDVRGKARVAIYGAIAVIFVGGIVSGAVPSFALLVLLAADFLLTDNRLNG